MLFFFGFLHLLTLHLQREVITEFGLVPFERVIHITSSFAVALAGAVSFVNIGLIQTFGSTTRNMHKGVMGVEHWSQKEPALQFPSLPEELQLGMNFQTGQDFLCLSDKNSLSTFEPKTYY